MILKRIENATRVLGAPSDWRDDGMSCIGLPIRDVETSKGNFMLSAWEPTAEELALLNVGQSLYLWIRGYQHPVVAITVAKPE
jgi:hypothetical protein